MCSSNKIEGGWKLECMLLFSVYVTVPIVYGKI